MKKENRQMAQVRKAQEKKKQAQMAKIKKIGMVVVPILVFAVLILVLYKVSSGTDDTSGSTGDTAGDTSTVTTLNTDTGLVVEDGDTVNIDYVGTIDGVEFSGGSTGGTGTDLTIGSGMYIDGFEDQLIGAHVGDTVEVICTFPDNYGATELAGQEAVFTTTINGIYE